MYFGMRRGGGGGGGGGESHRSHYKVYRCRHQTPCVLMFPLIHALPSGSCWWYVKTVWCLFGVKRRCIDVCGCLMWHLHMYEGSTDADYGHCLCVVFTPVSTRGLCDTLNKQGCGPLLKYTCYKCSMCGYSGPLVFKHNVYICLHSQLLL